MPNLNGAILVLVSLLTVGRSQLPSILNIPSDAPLAPASDLSPYIMTIYDEACVSQTNQTESGSETTTAAPPSEDVLSQWVQSSYVVYIGAVGLNANNTCQVVCQMQTLKQFAIMFGNTPNDIRTRSVLVGRVYMTTMPDQTACSAAGSDGVCSAGECMSTGPLTTTTMTPESTTMATTTEENLTTTTTTTTLAAA